jgi:hypothetical protein
VISYKPSSRARISSDVTSIEITHDSYKQEDRLRGP